MEMINAQRYLSYTAALRRVGINLLPGEELDAAVELETGLTDELEPSHEEFLYNPTAHSVLYGRTLRGYSQHRLGGRSLRRGQEAPVGVHRARFHRRRILAGHAVAVLACDADIATAYGGVAILNRARVLADVCRKHSWRGNCDRRFHAPQM